ncbi:hypothetical protein SAMN05192558_10448 [Actinokineospora alba]|uniref:Bifunctional DNA primase/polymerase, N-terminal n=1 Tax=Actinokineospora alba TaxID=504798 RepID=A0A1H0L830_9PSEU|nr:hypothetical protein [Actinokineospora alba]TDP67232.1 hypothetical protein C8E96_2767 [Actinokineospora alba]SDJ03396.1 hypothetical protein SAMN05421871_109249 [Actinokineospora alba]SDO64419.1 hypothetical protein SAMN05192558_10448 [Actinokineospora alba]
MTATTAYDNPDLTLTDCPWPITQDDRGRLVLELGEVAALSIRAGRAGEALSWFAGSAIRPTVLTRTGRTLQWVFLTQPETAMSLATRADLAYLSACSLTGRVLLPPAECDGVAIRWVIGPLPTWELPRWQHVVAATRATLAA